MNTCPVCLSAREPEPYEICTECYWEACSYQETHPLDGVGPNATPLFEAQENYKVFGACDSHGLWCKTLQTLSEKFQLDFTERWWLNLAWNAEWNLQELQVNQLKHGLVKHLNNTRKLGLKQASIVVRAMLDEVVFEAFSA